MVDFGFIEAALRVGFIGGTILFLLMTLSVKLNICSVNFMLLLGSSVTKKIEQGTEMLGFLIYLGASGLFGIIYSLVFMLFKTQGLSSGLILSTIHLLFTMIILIALMGKHPLLKTKSERKNFYSFYNIVVVGVLHLVYGAIFGVMY